jgi:hypothetical protein
MPFSRLDLLNKMPVRIKPRRTSVSRLQHGTVEDFCGKRAPDGSQKSQEFIGIYFSLEIGIAQA